MARNNRRGVDIPKQIMKTMKKVKRKRMRQIPIHTPIKEQQYNDARLEL
ncbi:hypothetical protein [Formosa sp. A9]